MIASLTVLGALFAVPCASTDVPTELWQVAPDTSEKPWDVPARPGEKTRAVVLIHGLFVHPLRPALATKPWRRDWQEPKSELVKVLSKDADVFAFAYAQITPVEDVTDGPGLRGAVARLRKAGYKEIVLVGHSAGGVIARQFVERYPTAGVTKVIAVAAPFAGVDLATLNVGYPKVQAPFVKSLAPEAREEAAKTNKPLGKNVELVCVVCKLKLVDTDGLVGTTSQWSADLQGLGVPVVHVPCDHFTVMYHPATANTIAKLIRDKLVRWEQNEVEQARKVLFGDK